MKIGTSTVTAIYLGTTSIVSAYLGATQVFGGTSAFTPLDRFSTGAQGIWLDPSDLSTMFSDRAGTTPVTTPGTVVGLRLDKSKGGVGTNGASRRNLLTWTEDFGNAVWVKRGFAAPTTGETDPLGGSTAVSFLENNTDANPAIYHNAVIPTAAVTVGVWLRASSATSINLSTNGNTTNGSVPVTTTWQFFSQTQTTATPILGPHVGGFGSVTRASGIRIYVWRPQLELGSTASAYQKITSDWASTMAGNHATAPTDAARPIYGVEPKGGRRNLLTWSEDFGNAAWVKTNATTNVDGSATRIVKISGATYGRVQQSFTSVASAYTFTVRVAAGTVPWVIIRLFDAALGYGVWFNATTGTLGSTENTLDATPTVTTVSPGIYDVTITKTLASGLSCQAQVGVTNADAAFTYSGTGYVLAYRAQLETGSTATAYQRVTTAYDVTESGVATCHYVQYDGSDDSMSTAAIDFTGTDKMSVFAGVRRTKTTTASGVIAELSAISTNNGSFGITDGTALTELFAASQGTVRATLTATVNTTPFSDLITMLGDISGDRLTLRANGTQVAQTTTDQGTGNFGNHSLFIGRRNNATLPFNGKDYGIVIVGKAASGTEITDTETWLAAKTSGVTL